MNCGRTASPGCDITQCLMCRMNWVCRPECVICRICAPPSNDEEAQANDIRCGECQDESTQTVEIAMGTRDVDPYGEAGMEGRDLHVASPAERHSHTAILRSQSNPKQTPIVVPYRDTASHDETRSAPRVRGNRKGPICSVCGKAGKEDRVIEPCWDCEERWVCVPGCYVC